MVVYTVITDSRDKLQPARFHDRVRHVCISDRPIKVEGWEYRHIEKKFKDTRRNSRWPKIRPERFLPDYKTSLYHDANFQLQEDPIALYKRWLDGANLALFRHPERNCLYAEARACKSMKLDTAINFDQQVERYRAANMPQHWGLFHAAVILRHHLEPNMLNLSQLWWDEYAAGSCRDQISLPYALWKTKTKYNIIPGNPYSCSLFVSVLHGA